jgi:hypothetical protein
MCSECQEMYEDCGCEGKKDKKETAMYASYMKRRSSAVKSMKESKDDLQSRYGDKWKSVMYANATRNAMEAVNLDEISKKKLANYLDKSHVEFKKTQASGSPMTDKQKRRYSTGSEAGDNAYNKQSGRARVNATEGVELDEISKKKVGEYSDKARDEFRKQQASGSPMTDKQKRRYSTGSDAGENAYNKQTGRARVNATEGVEHVRQALKAGEMKLSDGTTAKMSKEDVSALDALFKELTTANQTKMHDRMMKDKKSFAEIVSFAKESL